MRGVNLGNWLVLEKWINPSFFQGTDAEDETSFCINLSDAEKRARYDVHRNNYITNRDFANIAAMGFDSVRIPVPFFLFEDVGPYISCVQYLDRAFDWAEEYGLKVLVDLHTVPGGQNGTDNSGISGICIWANHKEYVDYTLNVLEKIAERYGQRSCLYGIEVLNEPMCSDTPTAAYMNIEMIRQQYPPANPEWAKENSNYSLEFLKNYYRESYLRIRKHMTAEKCVVFSDAFCINIWDQFFQEPEFENIVLDTHQYLTLAEMLDPSPNTLPKYQNYIAKMKEDLHIASQKFQVIVGEWSLITSPCDYSKMTSDEKSDFFQALSSSYLDALNECQGSFYWNYKLNHTDPSLYAWDVQRCINNKWLK